MTEMDNNYDPDTSFDTDIENKNITEPDNNEPPKSEAYLEGEQRYYINPNYFNPYHPGEQKEQFEDYSKGWIASREKNETFRTVESERKELEKKLGITFDKFTEKLEKDHPELKDSEDYNKLKEHIKQNDPHIITEKFEKDVDESLKPERNVSANSAEVRQIEEEKGLPQTDNIVESATDIDDASTETKLPPEIDRQFIHKGDGVYHFIDKPDQKALVIKDQKIQTPFSNKNIARTMVAVAEAKSWTELKIRGASTFKKEVWLQASLKGMKVTGYKPSKEDLALLSQHQKSEPNEIINQSENNKSKDGTITGKLVEHGKAPYQFKENNSQSYFVTLEEKTGKQHTSWGVDLERVIKENKVETGQEISLKNEGRKPVTIRQPIKNSQGEVTGYNEIKTHRNTWAIKADKLRNTEPDDLAKEHPDLINEIAAVKVAEKFSQDKFNSTEDQQRFVSTVKENLAKNLEKGQQNISVKINEQQQVKQQTREEPSHER